MGKTSQSQLLSKNQILQFSKKDSKEIEHAYFFLTLRQKFTDQFDFCIGRIKTVGSVMK